MKKVVIVVPIYKPELSLSEQVSLKQLYKVLGNYPICFVIPEKLTSRFENFWTECFPDKMFSSLLEYSRTLLNPFFYRRFQEFEYLLLYQLDAYVFSDKLLYFCNQGYDYIGAPIPCSQWRGLKARVGNGGLSLRKISSCINVTEIKDEIYASTGKRMEFEIAEDKFFAYCGVTEWIDFLVPKVKTALKFSIEYDVQHCYQRLSSSNLPFGCHGWSKLHNMNLWRKYITGYDKDLEVLYESVRNVKHVSYDDLYKAPIKKYLWERIEKYATLSQLKKYIESLAGNKSLILWGMGKIGREQLNFFKKLHIKIDYIIDENLKGHYYDGIKLIRPNDINLSNKEYYVIITTAKYEKEIAMRLCKCGLKKNEDFYMAKYIKNFIINKRYFYKNKLLYDDYT